MSNRYRINFETVPATGTRVEGWNGVWLTFSLAKPWTRADGTETYLLEWIADDGRRAVSGLRCRGPRWGTIAEAQARKPEAMA